MWKWAIFSVTFLGFLTAIVFVFNTHKTIFAQNHLAEANPPKLKIIKAVGDAKLDTFGLTDDDFQILKNSNVTVIEGTFDLCAKEKDIQFFLDNAQLYGLQVIMPAGSGKAAWGYQCQKDSYPTTQKPVWNKAEVIKFVTRWKDHPAVFGWDTSDEAGIGLPNANQNTFQNMISLEQLLAAYQDVKAVDPTHPIIVSQNGWFYYDYDNNFFRDGNPFGKKVSDIVMINAYSNVDEYFTDFVTSVSSRSIKAIHKIDPNVQIIISLGVWEEPPVWVKPQEFFLTHDLEQLSEFQTILGVGYFKYGVKDSDWYLPVDAPELMSIISFNP